jgi:hypothetical protein
MPEESTAPKVVKKITLPDGFRVGIIGLDNILKEVADLKYGDVRAIKQELVSRAKVDNYVPSGVEDEYASALFREYQQKFGGSEANSGGKKPEVHKHSG